MLIVDIGIPHATVNDDAYEGYYIPKGRSAQIGIETSAQNDFDKGLP